jgi:hypothetical protein
VIFNGVGYLVIKQLRGELLLPFFSAEINIDMRAKEFISELKKQKPLQAGDTTPHDYNYGWESLNYLRYTAERTGDKMAGNYQLFIPRGMRIPNTHQRSKDLLKSPYAWDSEGNLKPEYEKYYDIAKLRGEYHPAGKIDENAPILAPGKMPPVPGDNKPHGSFFWTSTAFKVDDKWSSDWNRWIISNQPGWTSDIGYLYKVKPGALILELDSDHDAENIFDAYRSLERVKEPGTASSTRSVLRSAFPWDQIVKHFDAVRHSRPYGRSEFMYGWDVESTVWFDTSFLQLVSEVPVSSYDDRDW